MDVFSVLRTGASFNSKKFNKDFKVFERDANKSTGPSEAKPKSDLKSLDFFKTPNTNKESSTQNAVPAKKKKRENPKIEATTNTSNTTSTTSTTTTSTSDSTTEVGNSSSVNQEELKKKNKIKTRGSDAPPPFHSFEELYERYSIKKYLKNNIAESGYASPTPIQMQCIPCMLQGREVLGCAPTGSGKTAAFILPILVSLHVPKKEGFRAVVVSPTRELATQTYREFKRFSKGKQWNSCLLTKATAASNAFGENSWKKFDVLICTPMRLVHLIQERAISLHNVEWLIFDEADKLFEMKFIEQIDTIIAECPAKNRKICLFSATMIPAVEQLAASVQKDPIRITVGAKNTATDTIKQRLMFVGSEEGKLLAIKQLIRQGEFKPPVLMFVQSKERAQQLFHELIYEGINVDVIHSNRTQAQRNLIVDKFRTGVIWVLITTDLISRGIDFKSVNLVINFDFPQSVSSYIHRIGRTGRAGRVGEAITFYTQDDFQQLRSIANVMKASGCEDLPEWIFTALAKPDKKKRKMLEYNPIQRADIESIPPKGTPSPKKKKKKFHAKQLNNGAE